MHCHALSCTVNSVSALCGIDNLSQNHTGSMLQCTMARGPTLMCEVVYRIGSSLCAIPHKSGAHACSYGTCDQPTATGLWFYTTNLAACSAQVLIMLEYMLAGAASIGVCMLAWDRRMYHTLEECRSARLAVWVATTLVCHTDMQQGSCLGEDAAQQYGLAYRRHLKCFQCALQLAGPVASLNNQA
jgi:hypothetical protein